AFVNTYRIDEAKKRLTDESYQQYTIAGIAYDCGFNSISTFNTTFKAMTKQTPTQFRKAFMKTRV
ncbi:MAG: helix-turn-helix domain-containing protein, partial [Bacteroidota bacterium]